MLVIVLASFTLILFIVIITLLFRNSCIDLFTKNSQFLSLESFVKNNNMPELLNLKVSDFYISSSHNSYIGNFQIGGISSTKNILNVLNNGARCIELDVHMKSSANSANPIKLLTNQLLTKVLPITTPMVSHKAGELKDIPTLSACLEVIRDNAFKYTTDPLFIYLEISDMDNKNYVIEISNVIRRILGSLLYSETLDKANYQTYCFNTAIKNLLNKICIIINFYNMNKGDGLIHRDQYLFPVVHATTDEPGPFGESGSGWFENYPLTNVVFGQSHFEDENKKLINTVGRVYPNNSILSNNYEIHKFYNANYNFIAMNYSVNMKEFEDYKLLFNRLQIIPQNYIISKDYIIIQPSAFYSSAYTNRYFKEYRNGTALFPLLKVGTVYSNGFSWENGIYTMTMQGDGNLVIYQNNRSRNSRTSIWSSNTGKNNGAKLWVQYDGNLVIYSESGNKVLWSAKTNYRNAIPDINGREIAYNSENKIIGYQSNDLHPCTYLSRYGKLTILRPSNSKVTQLIRIN